MVLTKMNTKRLLYVLTLAREGSFSKAADILNITQPSLSQYIKKIEREIGLELFDRANGDLRLTDAGKVYIDAGKQIIDIEHQMENSFTDIATYKTGSVIIGAAPYRAAAMLPSIARSFQSLHSSMHLIVREGTTAELVEGMVHGEYDLALTLLPIDDRLFTWERVMEEELVLAVPVGYPSIPATTIPERKCPAINIDELNRMPLVMLSETQYMQMLLNNLVLDYKIKPATAAVVKSLEAQIEFVKAGVGMALVPSGIERFCTDSSVTFYSFIPALPKRQVVVMWRKDRKLSKVAEELVSVIHSIEW